MAAPIRCRQAWSYIRIHRTVMARYIHSLHSAVRTVRRMAHRSIHKARNQPRRLPSANLSLQPHKEKALRGGRAFVFYFFGY